MEIIVKLDKPILNIKNQPIKNITSVKNLNGSDGKPKTQEQLMKEAEDIKVSDVLIDMIFNVTPGTNEEAAKLRRYAAKIENAKIKESAKLVLTEDGYKELMAMLEKSQLKNVVTVGFVIDYLEDLFDQYKEKKRKGD